MIKYTVFIKIMNLKEKEKILNGLFSSGADHL